jgi:hypothetical protein
MLRDFLAYAADGTMPPVAPERATAERAAAGQAVAGHAGVAASDPLRGELARRLRAGGLVVHEGFGSAAYPIDVAVEDPDRPGSVLVAVETDGPGYAAIASTRDRDRLRAEQLGRLGWMHVRVWSTDLFRDPARDVARVHAAVNQAAAARAEAEAAAAELAAAGPTPVEAAAPGPAAEEQSPEAEQPSGEVVASPDATDVSPGEADGPPEMSKELMDVPPQAAAAEEPDFTPQEDEAARKRRARTRKRRAPEQTRDDTDAGWGEYPNESAYDRWLREQRPPHWGHD